jgi:hypothetical protein
MADVGAVRIRDLLETPSAGLATAVEGVGNGLAAAEGLEATIPASTLTSIEKLRRIYSGLASQIQGIDTNGAIKAEALAALAKMDIGLERLGEGANQPPSEESARALSMAVRRLEAGGAGIDAAIAGVR